MKYFLKFELKTLNKKILIIYNTFVIALLLKLKIYYSIQNLSTKIKKITLLRSPHVYKKAREQFEVRSYKAVIFIFHYHNNNLLKFLLLNKPSEINLSIKKYLKQKND